MSSPSRPSLVARALMGSSCPEAASPQACSQGARTSDPTPEYEAIRARIASRHRRRDDGGGVDWDAVRPAVLDLAAAATARLHERLSGRAGLLGELRGAKYVRKQLIGESCLLLEDLALVALDEPEAFVAGVAPLLEAAGYLPPEPMAGSPASLAQAAASFVRTAGGVSGETFRALEDGVASPEEIERISREVEAHEAHVASLKLELARQRRSRR